MIKCMPRRYLSGLNMKVLTARKDGTEYAGRSITWEVLMWVRMWVRMTIEDGHKMVWRKCFSVVCVAGWSPESWADMARICFWRTSYSV